MRLTGFAPAPIPGPRALPFIGPQANALRIIADPIGRLTEMHRVHGDVAAAAGGSPALVCAFGAERNREVLSNAATFENDSDFFIEFPLGSNLRKLVSGIVFQPGEAARRTRRLMMPAFQKTALDGYAKDIAAVTTAALDAWPVGATTDVAALTRELVQRVAVQCFFGLDGVAGSRDLGHIVTEWIDLLTSPLVIALQRRIPGTPYSRLFDLADEIVAQLLRLFAQKRATPGTGRDALALVMNARDDDGRGLTDDELIGEATALYVAGHDTQAKTLAWTLFLLEQHPKILADLLDELDSVLHGAPPHAGGLRAPPAARPRPQGEHARPQSCADPLRASVSVRGASRPVYAAARRQRAAQPPRRLPTTKAKRCLDSPAFLRPPSPARGRSRSSVFTPT
ncbi:MAG: cytochrome P450 [Polyangiaceae bacterium]